MGRYERSKRKVLVADDDDGIRGLLRIVLEQRGYEVVTAHSGADALKLAITQHPSIVILDLNMPGMDGGPERPWDTPPRRINYRRVLH